MRNVFCAVGLLAAGWTCALPAAWADDVVWTCSRAESEQSVFDGVRAFRIEDLSLKDDYGIAITLSDLFNAYAGETIQMGKKLLHVCSLPPLDPLQTNALNMLGYRPEDLRKAMKNPRSRLVSIPSIHEMVKCIAENHPAVGFFPVVVENESMSPCF